MIVRRDERRSVHLQRARHDTPSAMALPHPPNPVRGVHPPAGRCAGSGKARENALPPAPATVPASTALPPPCSSAPAARRLAGTEIRRAISIAAINCAAFAPFSPFTWSSAITGASTIARNDPNCFNNCLAISTAFVPLKPARSRIATNSASVSAWAPLDNNRSRGRSSCGHAPMPVVLGFDAGIQVAPEKRRFARMCWAGRTTILCFASPRAFTIK